jgi:hypothetical protein
MDRAIGSVSVRFCCLVVENAFFSTVSRKLSSFGLRFGGQFGIKQLFILVSGLLLMGDERLCPELQGTGVFFGQCIIGVHLQESRLVSDGFFSVRLELEDTVG